MFFWLAVLSLLFASSETTIISCFTTEYLILKTLFINHFPILILKMSVDLPQKVRLYSNFIQGLSSVFHRA
ncbi:hypothetical protein EC523_13645 [Avibacterium paragallinarum]|nr:hypothetical protein EC523_13645 [Avibacterium paragallinarum]